MFRLLFRSIRVSVIGFNGCINSNAKSCNKSNIWS
nr:MAG TPA: hypothetical protein [Caudoviricetes sp.]